jgi:hypothetical protein
MEPCASYCLEFEEDVHEKVKNLALFLMVAEFSSRMRGGKKKGLYACVNQKFRIQLLIIRLRFFQGV